MVTATFRFYGPLNDFLPKRQRQTPFDCPVNQQATIKDVIESLGVPHPEVGLILANSRAVSFNYRMQADDRCSVYPAFYDLDVSAMAPLPAPLPSPLRFVLDTHLGKLATYLRLLGFDTLYRNTFGDEELAQLSGRDKRVLLNPQPRASDAQRSAVRLLCSEYAAVSTTAGDYTSVRIKNAADAV